MKAILTAIAVVITAVFVFSNPIMAANADSTAASPAFFHGDRGAFNWRNGEFSVLRPYNINNPEKGSYGDCNGIITPKTIVRFVNMPNLTKKDLFLLDGKEVLVWGKFRSEGKGESTKIYALEINIAIMGVEN